MKTFLERLQGENLVVRAYGAEIQPCTDCRYCWTNDGCVILVGGGDGSGQRANETARILLKHMNCQHIEPMVCSHDTNRVPAREDEKAIVAVRELAERFNQSFPNG